MSTLSPLQPHGGLDQASTPRSRVRITVLTILAVHVVFIGGLLLQGCKKDSGTGAASGSNTIGALPSLVDTNYFTSFPGDAQRDRATGTPAFPGDSATGAAGTDSRSGTAGGTVGSAAGRLPPIDPGSVAPGGSASPVGFSATSGQPTEHVVKKGDTIGDLAKKYHVTEQAILDANPSVKPRSLRIDTKLAIPAPSVASVAADAGPVASTGASGSAANGEVYVVKQGDNLDKIARKYGVTVKQLRAANNIKGDTIVPKQRLVIPARAPEAAAPAPAPAPPAGGGASPNNI